MAAFNLSIISPRGKVFGGSAEFLIASGAEGELGVLAGHAPMIALLQRGIGRVDAEGKQQHYVFGEGVLEVSREEVVMLVDNAEAAANLDAAKVMMKELLAATGKK
jgi:F-type H+-transporting ATPase subunit epsilon